MKILRIVGNLYPTFYGGVEVHTHSMSIIQSKMNCDVTILTCDYDFTKTNIFKNYNVISPQSWFRILGNPISPQFLLDFLKLRKQFDIIHAHDVLFITTNVAAFFRNANSPPLIITNHGLISQTAPVWLSTLYYLSLGLFTLRSADRIICYTDHDKNELVSMGIDPEVIAVIHNGVNTEIFIPKVERRVRGTNILWIGRYTHGKGIRDLINAFALLIKKIPDSHLLMIGDGPQIGEIQQLIQELNLSGHITQKPFIPNENLPEVYQSSDIFVLPSINEGVPRTILEAMSCGIPVICTDLPQLGAIVEGCGIVVPIRDPTGLADAMYRIISDKDYAKDCGIHGREKVISHYSWDDTVRQTLALYEEVIQLKKTNEMVLES